MRDQNGKRVSKTFATKEDMEEFVLNFRRQRYRLRAGLEVEKPQVLFFDFAAEWLKNRIETMPRSTTDGDESKMRRVWVPLLAQRALSTIKREDIEPELEELMRGKHGIGPRTRNMHRALLHTLFEDALKKNLINTNPISAIPVLTEPKRARRWQHEHVEKLVKEAGKMGPIWKALYTILAWAGPRANEALALRWQDILWTSQAIVIRRIREVASGKLVERTKGKRVYTRPLIPLVAAELRRWQRTAPALKPEDLIFSKGEREPVTYWMAENMHQKLVEATGVPYDTLHAFRHFYASQLRRVGFQKEEIKDIVGHKDVQTTEGYIHELPNMRPVVKKARELGFGRAEFLQ